MDRTAWRQVMPLYLVVLIGFPIGMLWLDTHALGGPTSCLFRQVTHLDCPSCGMTRAFQAMGKLDVAGAFRYNPLGPVVFVASIVLWGYAAACVFVRRRVSLPRWWRQWQPRILWGALAVYLLVGAGRIAYELRHPPPPPVPVPLARPFGLPHSIGRD